MAITIYKAKWLMSKYRRQVLGESKRGEDIIILVTETEQVALGLILQS